MTIIMMKASLSMSPRSIMIIIAAFLIMMALLGRIFFASSLTQSHVHGYTMGTKYSVKYRHPEGGFTPDTAQKQIESVLDEINRAMSTYDPESELSRLNRATTSDWIPVSDSLFTVLEAALEIGARSEKAFDITVGPAVNLWGFGPEFHSERIPDKSEIAAVLPAIGQDKLVLDRETHAIRKLHSDIYIDLSAIAKGYAVDRVAEIFDARGIEHYLVEIGGEIRARGTNAQNTPWQIGIEKPHHQYGRSAPYKILSLQDTGLATSGDYQNFFEIEGHRYSHLIDPTTGWPVENGASSVTVLAESCMVADAWATALLVLGHERGLTIAEDQGIAVLFIVNQEGVIKGYTSSHFPAERASDFTQIFIATFLVMGLALIAMAIGVIGGRQPLAGSCGGLGRMGLGCEAGCDQSCTKHDGKNSVH